MITARVVTNYEITGSLQTIIPDVNCAILYTTRNGNPQVSPSDLLQVGLSIGDCLRL